MQLIMHGLGGAAGLPFRGPVIDGPGGREAGGQRPLERARQGCQTRVMATDGSVTRKTSAHGFAPCFPVRDMQAALAHYEQLGFEVMPYTGGMTWAWAKLGSAELHLLVKEDHDPATTAAAADLEVDNAGELERAFRVTAVNGTSDPYDTPYGREFVHVGPDNNLMRFVSPAVAHTETPHTGRSLTQP
jgi:hypothetical protein